jgi:hypothetical protein
MCHTGQLLIENETKIMTGALTLFMVMEIQAPLEYRGQNGSSKVNKSNLSIMHAIAHIAPQRLLLPGQRARSCVS